MENGKVKLISSDPVKQCMAEGWFPESRLFPKIKQIGSGEYEMKYYPKVSSLKNNLVPLHYGYYKRLREIHKQYCYSQNPYDMYSLLTRKFEKLPKYLRENLQGAIDGLSNYGTDIGFEISPRNVAVTKTGKLILLDCFFLRSQLPTFN